MYLHFEMAPLKRTICRLKLLKYTRVNVTYIWLKIKSRFYAKKTPKRIDILTVYKSFRKAFFADGVILPFFQVITPFILSFNYIDDTFRLL